MAMRILLDADSSDSAEDCQSSGTNETEAIPVIALVSDSAEEHLAAKLAAPDVAAISGYGVNSLVDGGEDAVKAARARFAACGIEMEEHKKAAFTWADFKKGPDGLLPVVVQEDSTDQVLMVAYMNEEAFNMTVDTGRMTYFSRSRKSLWIKGETSGHFQYVKSLTADCDKDTLLAKVSQVGVACHTGSYSCFFREIIKKDYTDKDPRKVLEDVYAVIADRKEHPKEGSYTNYLFDKGIDKILKKVGEEATEIVIAAKNPDKEEVKYEISDFIYHCMVLMVEKGVTWDEIMSDLASR
jgi:phosphoribosyl-ATP pyrophosphohydrolase/phosphoribosyl-AMP cyclohydrolase